MWLNLFLLKEADNHILITNKDKSIERVFSHEKISSSCNIKKLWNLAFIE